MSSNYVKYKRFTHKIFYDVILITMYNFKWLENCILHYDFILLLVMYCSCTFIFVSAQLWPDLIHIILSTNMSQTHNLQISTEYFIDQEKYFYLSLFHVNATTVVGCFIVIATGTMLVAYLQHACGMFKIASYRIETAISILKHINLQNQILAYKGIVRAVDIHRKAIIFSNYLISNFEISFMFLIVIGVLSLSLNVFRVFQTVLLGYNTEDFLINFVLAVNIFLYMFLANFLGQQIIDHNNHVYATAYKSQWYISPLPIQKLILFLLQRGNKSYGLCVGRLFIASIECFTTLTNAAISYFTVIYSIR